MAFRGSYEYNLDGKNRLVIPAKLREELEGPLVLAKGVEPCVTLWKASDYEQYVASVFKRLNPLSPEARQLKRYFAANAQDIELDSAGRVMIPNFLMEHAELTKAAVITGALEYLEIWDREKWQAYNEDLSARMPEITALLPGEENEES